MKVVYTAGARSDLDEIGEWLSDHYPTIALDYDPIQLNRIIV